MLKKLSLLLFFLVIFYLVKPTTIGAQTTLTETGISVVVNDSNVQDGDIICSGSNGYKLCTSEYDSSMYGIVNSNSSTSLTVGNIQNSQIVVSRGEVELRVTAAGGNIKKGDFLTSSKTAGVATIATSNGYVIGNALEDYAPVNKSDIGKIKVSLNIHARTGVTNTKENLLDLLRSGLSGLGVSPIAALRYLLASAMVLTSFAIGLIYFGRIAKTGVEAIGRNPLAGIRIQASVIINILIMVAVVFVGLAVAYLILAI